MFEISTILNVTSASSVYSRHNRTEYKSTLEGSHIFPIGEPIPLFVNGRCDGMAKIISFTVDEYGTSVHYSKIQVSEKLCRELERLYAMMGNRSGDANASRVDRDTERTGMSAAARMMMGSDRSARQIARDAEDDDDDDEDRPKGIWEMMRDANPDDPLFR